MDVLTFKSNCRVERDRKKRKDFRKFELSKQVWKSVALDQTIPSSIRKISALKLNEKKALGSRSRIKNRCVITGRSRSVFKKFRLSRIMIRNLAIKGDLPNLSKSSW